MVSFIVIACFGTNNSKSERNETVKIEPLEFMENRSYATFGGGCFWCTEAIFEQLEGVEKVASGFSGGHIKNPAYREVISGRTGHAEVIQITYNPQVINYNTLLEVFFNTHDPTTLNRQGADRGTQYRSAIFYHNEEQQKAANNLIEALEEAKVFKDPIVTEVTQFDAFYEAEQYHQDYYANNQSQGYCQVVIRPKLEKFQKAYRDKLKKSM